MEVLFIIVGLIIGAVIAWLFVNQKSAAVIATLQSELQNSNTKISETNTELENLKQELENEKKLKGDVERKALEFELREASVKQELSSANERLNKVVEELDQKTSDFNNVNTQLATANANNKSLIEKHDSQKQEIEKLNEKFTTEFENIANRILEEKTDKFTKTNKSNIEMLLKPLGDNLDKFKAKVEEVYDKESKERFSLGEKVKELAELNQVISDEAKNLTRALKGESKTRGLWGEMILESILEKSGLVKDREYFIEHQLTDDEGNAILSESEGKKMRPDVVIKYPDKRSVIIDSKVSLLAFTRYMDAVDPEEQQRELAAHVGSMKMHINALSSKGYDDYDKALDFVMMFIPSESAYIAAMQGDPNLWNFAYDKRILLLNPTNLITSLKLIVDLWKREYQNQNAIEIAERGAKLYDKFVGFISNMEDIGSHIGKAQNKYEEAFKQLSTGNDNLVVQATKLKNLGLKPKKQLPKEIENQALQNTVEGE
ncbi:DNA recombination protein RmuC [Fluviicola sp.]|uniref:DNA recombination protein RmuC n=1 Tax=Fluviicola sp. TaxID=1917219 RepID=UPI0031DA77CF